MENTTAIAYAFMVMLAGLAVLSHYERASAQMSAAAYAPAAAAPAFTNNGGSMAPVPQLQYGLVQTGVVGVSRLDAAGSFGAPSVMPVYQIIQLQMPQGAAVAGAVGMEGAPRPMVSAPAAPVASAEQPAATSVPHGIAVAPAAGAQMGATVCEINGVRVLTPSATTCGSAGGQVPSL